MTFFEKIWHGASPESYWLHKSEQLWNEQSPDLFEAMRSEDVARMQAVKERIEFFRAPVLAELWSVRSFKLAERARKLGIDVPYVKLDGESDNTWQQGYRIRLTEQAYVDLTKKIRQAAKEHWKRRREVVTFWFSILVGLTGLFLAVYSAVSMNKRVSNFSDRLTRLEERVSK